MIDPALFAAFLFAAFVLTITPGLDTAMVLRAAASDGARAGVFASIGILVGCLVWGAAVSLGLGALLHASERAYSIVKWAGAAYLLWVGVTMLIRPRATMAADANASRAAGIRAMRRGFLTNMLNPKIGIFYVTFLPQLIPAGANVAGYSFFLACVHVAITVLWFALLIAATAPLGRMLRQPKILKSLDRMTGGVFIAFGLKLAASRA